MLNYLKSQMNLTHTENGAVTLRSSGTECLDLFFRAGGMREAAEGDIQSLVLRAMTEDPVKAMKILFFIRDVRGGLGERRFFRTAMTMLAEQYPDAVRRNVHLFAEYGRFDDLCTLLGTPCEDAAVALIAAQLKSDLDGMAQEQPVSLLAKWLPSVNASSAETVARGKYLAKALKMPEKQYRKMLAALRRYTDIIENRLRECDYTFDYEKQPSGAMFKYRQAFSRNDAERYAAYLSAVEKHEAVMHTATLYPYDIVRACKFDCWGRATTSISAEERRSLNAAWENLPVFGANGENALAVIDGSGSMYSNGTALRPIDVALSLGIYFAEHNQGAFKNHFVTFSRSPQLVEIKGKDIVEKVQYCASYNEVANTDIEAVFRLLLTTAVQNRLPQSEMPAKIYIISDMEFDYCVTGGNNETVFETMRKRFARCGYRLPDVIFWNVASRQQNIPVSRTETGAALVSGASPAIFDMVIGGEITPENIMNRIIEGERYAKVS